MGFSLILSFLILALSMFWEANLLFIGIVGNIILIALNFVKQLRYLKIFGSQIEKVKSNVRANIRKLTKTKDISKSPRSKMALPKFKGAGKPRTRKTELGKAASEGPNNKVSTLQASKHPRIASTTDSNVLNSLKVPNMPNLDQEGTDKGLMQKFEKILRASNKVKQAQIAQYLGISEHELFALLISWSELLPFKIEDEYVVVEDMQQFTEILEQDFADWEEREHTKDGKVDNTNLKK